MHASITVAHIRKTRQDEGSNLTLFITCEQKPLRLYTGYIFTIDPTLSTQPLTDMYITSGGISDVIARQRNCIPFFKNLFIVKDNLFFYLEISVSSSF